MNMTDYLANELRDHVLKGLTYTAPTTVYAALFTTATTNAGGGTEVTGGSYARQAISAWTDGDAGRATNTNALTFTNMPAGTVVNIAIFDALTSGNMLLHKALNVPRTYTAGDNGTFAAGALLGAFR